MRVLNFTLKNISDDSLDFSPEIGSTQSGLCQIFQLATVFQIAVFIPVAWYIHSRISSMSLWYYIESPVA